jgi:hypothetical protein
MYSHIFMYIYMYIYVYAYEQEFGDAGDGKISIYNNIHICIYMN